MRRTRWLGPIVTAACAVASVVVLAGPAHAIYKQEPMALAWNPDGPVHASLADNGVVYLGGKLDGTGGIAAVDASTGSLLWMIPADKDVRALALSPDGSILYAGGGFTTVGGATHRQVVAIKLADHSVIATWKGAAAGQVRDLVARGNDLYVAGKVTTVGGVPQRGIGALVAATGKHDPAFDFQADNDVLGLAVTGNRLILSGSFTTINGVPRAELASIDLSTNTLTDWNPPKLCGNCDQYWDVQTDGTNAYVATSGNAGGAFSLATGQPAWPTIRGTGDFQAVWVPGDGRAYYGGHFGEGVWVSGQSQNQILAKLLVAVKTADGSLDGTWLPRVITAYPGIWCFTSTYGKLWVGGDFTGELVNGVNNHKPYVAAYPDPNVVVDKQAPTGTFHTDTTSGWAGLTSVRIIQTAIHDNSTPDDLIGRSVDWGDGHSSDWPSGTTVSHVYTTAGTFTPRVTLTDQAGNSSHPIDSSTVTVKDDKTAPVVALQIPRHQHSVAAWKTLRGKATDSGIGVRSVWLKAVEKRGKAWYGYRPATHTWVKAKTKAKAFTKADAFVLTTNAQHRWSAKLAGLHKGKLVYKVRATDEMSNRSRVLIHTATLTHR